MNSNFNYFTVVDTRDFTAGTDYVLLTLQPDYGPRREVEIAVTGRAAEFPQGKRIELNVALVKE